MKTLLAIISLSFPVFAQCSLVQTKASASPVSITAASGNSLLVFGPSATDASDTFAGVTPGAWLAATTAGGSLSVASSGLVTVAELHGCTLAGSASGSGSGWTLLAGPLPTNTLVFAVALAAAGGNWSAGSGMTLGPIASALGSFTVSEFGAGISLVTVTNIGNSGPQTLAAVAFTNAPPPQPPNTCQCFTVSTQSIPPTRTIGGQPLFAADYYFNSPVNQLPLDPQSAAKIASLGVGRLGPSPEFILNVVTGQHAGGNIAWQNTNPENDGGNYPITPSTNVSQYVFGAPNQPLSGWTTFGQDSHMLIINTTTGVLYETYGVSSNMPPYQLGTGAIWDLNSYALRSAVKLIPYGVDSSGLTSADAAGMPIWPLVLTHAEVFSGAPIVHGMRMALTSANTSAGYQWPATHQAGGSGNSGILLGATFRLNANFDSSAMPPWAQPLITALKTYGLYFTDLTGNPVNNGLIGTDADQAWGDPSLSTSDTWALAGVLHQIPLSALEVVENQPRIINILSGQVNQKPPYR